MRVIVWLRIIRIKFLLASIIAITNGILYSYLTYNIFNIIDALLTYVGVIFLHASVDIFNDYWDYKRGIDTTTKRTNFSGGTGVLPEKKLDPRDGPPWLIDNDRRVLSSIIGNANEMSLEELCARTIGSLYSTAYKLANANSMLLNYNQLSVPVIASVLNFFNVSLSSEELETIARTSKVYSKEVSGTRAFVDDVDAKQKLASNLVREMSERWAGEPYRLLEQKRNSNP